MAQLAVVSISRLGLRLQGFLRNFMLAAPVSAAWQEESRPGGRYSLAAALPERRRCAPAAPARTENPIRCPSLSLPSGGGWQAHRRRRRAGRHAATTPRQRWVSSAVLHGRRCGRKHGQHLQPEPQRAVATRPLASYHPAVLCWALRRAPATAAAPLLQHQPASASAQPPGTGRAAGRASRLCACP